MMIFRVIARWCLPKGWERVWQDGKERDEIRLMFMDLWDAVASNGFSVDDVMENWRWPDGSGT